MTRETYIVGNWKMNQTRSEIDHFFNTLKEDPRKSKAHLWIAPQALHIDYCLQKVKGCEMEIGAQNIADHSFGAYTGELSPVSLKDMGGTFTIIGHSERRQIYGERDQFLNSKVILALNSGLKVIFCVGETLTERETGQTNAVVARQLREGLKNLPDTSHLNFIIAYEPVWAIGTGKTATPHQAQEVHQFIRTECLPFLNLPVEKTAILYGGSVNPSNIKELLGQQDIDGALVGGASLKAPDYLKLAFPA